MTTKYKLDATTPLEQLNALNKGTMAEHIGIEYVELTEDYLKARMPVDHRTWQPLKMLNGGASLALAETVGSMAANLVIDRNEYVALGLDINANHLKAAMTGYVYGTARPYHVGKSTQVWEIRIEDEEGNLTCISRLTMSNVKINGEAKYARKVEI
ncbi:hotdog fold thioesterase [Oscillatoria amoena NRMC-F 0135]|nr:MAG: hotdog fold thioesterase [Bacteroidota bacterium]MDL5049899.1 hotdog fold thioesterase [Oscillatoria amoena NRMC-F 0135]